MAESQESTMLKDNFYDLSQLLRQRAGSHFAIQFTDSTAHHSVDATSTLFVERQPEPQRAAPAPSLSPTRVAPRRVRFNPRYVTPSLPKHNTAPASTGLLTEREETRKMYQTFNGAMDAPGDTQADPEMFKEFTSGLLESDSMLGVAAQPLVSVMEEGSQDSARDNSVMASSQSQRSGAITSPMTVNDDSETQARSHYAPTSPLKLFETPAYAGRKRDNQGQMLSSVARTNTTPGTELSASAFFGFGDTGNVDAMSLTQAFNATQAKTSPAVGEPSEDVVFQRPSPNFAHPRHSSPGANMSSPIKPSKAREPVTDPALRSSSEPRAEYESMRQSQERRRQERPSQHIDTVGQDSWEEPTDAQKHFFRQKARERLNQEAAKSLAGVSAPIISTRRTRKRGFVSTSAAMTSPKKVAVGRGATVQGIYDGSGTDPPHDLSQPLPRPGDGEDSSAESSQESPFRTSHSLAPVVAVKEPSTDQRVQVPHTSSHPLYTLSEPSSRNLSQPDTPLSQPQLELQARLSASQPLPRGLTKFRSSKDTEVVMDSQPDPATTPSASRPATLRYPSSPSTNQYSINQTTMLSKSRMISSPISSMPPMPPKSSSQELGNTIERGDTAGGAEEGVPSSPPLLTQEDDVTYDEHAYDEHSDDDREANEAHSSGDEMDVDGHDDQVEDEDGSLTPRGVISRDIKLKREGQPEEDIQPDEPDRNDDEVPETIEPENENHVLIHSRHPQDNQDASEGPSMGPPGVKRRSIIPESDVLEETQPSFFPDAEHATQMDTSTGAVASANFDQNQTGSTERYDTAKEQQSASQVVKEASGISGEGVTTPSPVTNKGPSLLDIANQPDTQRSVDLDDIDLPQLSIAEDSDDPLDAMIARSSPFLPQKKRKTTYSTKKAFRSPIKETDPLSDQLTSSPQPGLSYTSGWSPPTTQDQEARGAQAATRAREKAGIVNSGNLISKARSKPVQPRTSRMGALKTVNKTLLTKSPGKTSSKTGLQDRTAEVLTSFETEDADMGNEDRPDVADGPIPDTDVLNTGYTIATASDDGELPSGDLLVPNRVFAFWPGNGYYPATCIGRIDSHRLRVCYDDGTINTLESVQVRALDLRPGDQVKIEVTGMKKHAYVVVGFKNKITAAEGTTEYPLTNRHGYATIILQEKQRESMAAKAPLEEKEHIAVPVSSIYLTAQLWARLKDRQFQYKPTAGDSGSASRAGTPRLVDTAVPNSTSLRRSTAGPSLLRDSIARAPSVASSTRSGGNVFLNMAFAITTITPKGDALDRDGISRLITSNGGLIVDEGFHELFETDLYDAPMSSAGSAKTAPEVDSLQLKQKHQDLRFVALIAQSHSRKPKYIQALSLNVPCLHLRWIHDSLSAGRPLPFAKYLLPAGTSTFLDPEGVVRSRDITTYDPDSEEGNFAQVVKERTLLFRNQAVLIVTEEDMEGQEPYMFLTHAMGAAEVGQCTDLDEAKDLVKDGKWDWVYVDGKPEALGNAAAQLLGISTHANDGKNTRKRGSKKRKRDDHVEDQALVRSGFVGKKKVKVACGEFVIQSLILGALIEE
ncbi:radiation sensitive protein rad9 [Kalmusia sp. IMI 367209]|nr:radiation sensitive protein rad9 [Kalmusia sp. IMI 367209]